MHNDFKILNSNDSICHFKHTHIVGMMDEVCFWSLVLLCTVGTTQNEWRHKWYWITLSDSRAGLWLCAWQLLSPSKCKHHLFTPATEETLITRKTWLDKLSYDASAGPWHQSKGEVNLLTGIPENLFKHKIIKYIFFNSCCQLITAKLLEGMQDKRKKAYLFMHGLYMTILCTSTYCVTICIAGDFIQNGHKNVQHWGRFCKMDSWKELGNCQTLSSPSSFLQNPIGFP